MARTSPHLLPNYLIIGAPRAGTSWMAKSLGEHPDVFMSPIKELHFFDSHYDKGLGYYSAFFAAREQERAVGEATPGYLHGLYSENDIPALIKKHLPDVKLIASLRNPVDRLYSRYWNAKAKYPENRHLSFEEKLRQKPAFIEEGFYYDQLVRYYQHFSREQIQVLLFDDLERDSEDFLRQMFVFLQVDPDFVPATAGIRLNTASTKGYLGRTKVLWYLYRGLRRFGAFGASSFVENLNKADLPPMRAETREWLMEIYRERNQKLQDLIERDLSAWNRTE